SAQIDPFAAIDYSLVNKPVIARDGGEFYGVGKHRESPFSPAPFLLPNEGDHMLLLGLSEFSANSAAFVYFTAGALRKNFRDDMVRHRGSQRCRTREGPFCFLGGSSGEPPPLPDLAKQLPLHLFARKQPLLTCRPDSLDLALFGTAEAFVVLPNATLASAFLLDLVSAGHSPGPTHLASWIPLSEGRRRMGAGLQSPARPPTGSGSSPLTRAPFVSPEKLKKGFPLPNVYNLSLVNPRVKINQVGISHGLGSTSSPVSALGTPKPMARCLFRWGEGIFDRDSGGYLKTLLFFGRQLRNSAPSDNC
uniref:Bactericidal permeability-increasing protein n=1 Tax=Chrysemys picta bellii TaxID=8478 RepID=A0A8C3J056_CHRPI